MSEKRTCLGCHAEYWWPNQRWIHDRCAINASAINTANGEQPLDQPVIPVAAVTTAVGCDSAERRTPNRRLRADYNAYMREYMRKRRAG